MKMPTSSLERRKNFVSVPLKEFEEMLSRAAEEGAKRALSDVGLEGAAAGEEIRELRSLLSALQTARRTALKTIVRVITTGILIALLMGLALKLKIFPVLEGK